MTCIHNNSLSAPCSECERISRTYGLDPWRRWTRADVWTPWPKRTTGDYRLGYVPWN
jgi:hypothetical protein